MNDLFKNMSWYIMQGNCTTSLHMLKYILGVQRIYEEVAARSPYKQEFISDHFKTQKMCNNEVRENRKQLYYVLDHFKTHEICIETVSIGSLSLKYVPYWFKTQEMYDKAVHIELGSLECVPDHFKTQEMCDNAVRDHFFSLQYVPDWFVTQQQVKIWHNDSEYYDDDEVIKWYDGCKKCRAQKAKIKE